MFASRAWSGSVCLRCQLHLARSSLRRSTTLSLRRLYTSHDEQSFKAALDGKEDEAEAIAERPQKAPRAKQFFRTRGKRVFMKAEELGTGILGKPAHAIVMRDGGRTIRREIPVDESLNAPAEHIDFGALLEEEDSTPGLEEVLRNIEELRPKHLTISAREFNNLKDILLHGFTSTQLASYIRKHELLQSHDIGSNLVDLPKAAEKQQQDIYPWIIERSQWLPQESGSEDSSDPRLRGYISGTMTPKEKLVVRLMRQYWEVSIQELQAGEGYLDVRVREPEFALLTLGSQRWLRGIARYLLSPGRQIEIIPSESTVRIVAPKTAAETVLEEINNTLQNVRSKTIDTRPISSSPLDSAHLAEVGRLTNSIIEPLESGHEIRVTWVNVEDRSSVLEDLGDRVYRLLLTSQQQQSAATKLLVYPQNHESARFVMEYGVKEKVAWSDRLASWARWTAPRVSWDKAVSPETLFSNKKPLPSEAVSTQEGVSSESQEPDKFDQLLDNIVHSTETRDDKKVTFRKVLSSPIVPLLKIDVDPPKKPSSSQSQLWSPKATTTSALFGHLLHRQSPGPKQTIIKAPINHDAHRVLLPAIPPVFNFNPPGYIFPFYLDATILMRFLPESHRNNTASTKHAPPLELALKIREPRVEQSYVSSITALRAVLNTEATDVSLPDLSVDFRLTRSTTAQLPGDAMFNAPGMASLHDFLSKSRLEPQNGRIETPARMPGLGLPKHILSSTEITLGDASVDPAGDELVDVDYIFAGLEVRHVLETVCDGWKLVYTSIEAGQGGGKRAEFSLEAAPGWDWKHSRKAEDFSGDAFIDSVYRLAAGESLSWAESSWNDIM